MRRKITEPFTLLKKLRATSQNRVLAGLLIVTLSILVSAAISAPFFYSNSTQPGQVEIRQTHDMAIHLSVMEQFDKVLRSGAVYPRWLPDVNYGYGNAWPNFYQPGFYYLTSLVNAVTDNWVDTLFAITALGLAASGLALYVLARVFFGKPASAIAAMVYALLPYHLLDVFWRGAVPEYLSFVVVPLTLFFFYRVGSKGHPRYYAGLAVCYGSCVMIHVPIAYLLSYILVFYALAWAAARRDWRIAGRIGLGMTGGVLMSAIYWIPAVAEIKDAVETVTTRFQYPKNYVALLDSVDPYGHLLKETFPIQSVALLLVVAAVLWLKRRQSRGFNLSEAWAGTGTRFSHESVWIVLGTLSIFMNLPLSYYVARLIPRIDVVAFPYRWMVFVCLFTSLLTAALVERLSRRVRGPANIGVAGRVAFSAAMTVLVLNIWFSAQAVIIPALSSPMVPPYVDFLCDTYCPAGAPPAGDLPKTERIVVGSKTGSSEVIQWESLYRQAVITTDEPTTARFKTFNFPGWTARVDGADAPIFSDPVAAQVIRVPQGRHTVEITFISTPARNLGAALSATGALLVCLMAFTGRLWPGRRRQLPGANAGAAQASPEAFALTEPLPPQAIHSETSATHDGIKKVASLWLIGIVLAAGVFSAVMLINELSFENKREKVYVQPMRSSIGVGSDAKLSVGTSNEITVAADDRSLRELIDAISMGDDRKMETLLQSGRAFTVERDTKVRVLQLVGGKVRVEILEGGNANKEGWVLEGWLK